MLFLNMVCLVVASPVLRALKSSDKVHFEAAAGVKPGIKKKKHDRLSWVSRGGTKTEISRGGTKTEISRGGTKTEISKGGPKTEISKGGTKTGILNSPIEQPASALGSC
jgi:hypothetical protein